MLQSVAIILLMFAFGSPLRLPYSDEVARGKQFLQETPGVFIQWPQPRQALLGNIEISGTTAVDGFKSADLSFGYANDTTDTWFLITQIDSPTENGVLTNWDTTVISDGNYNLKLSVTLQDGALITYIVQGVRVRNYSPIEVDTPTPTFTQAPVDEPLPTTTPTSTLTPIPPSPTPLPTNPIVLTSADFIAGFGRGVLIVLALFIFFGVYLGVRSMMRNRT